MVSLLNDWADFVGRESNPGFMKPLFSRFDFHLCKCFFEIR